MTRDERIEANKNLINRYKTDIDLVAFTESMGFQLNKKHSSRGYPMMEDPSTGRKLIISQDRVTRDFKFFNPEDTRDKGNVIHLAAEKYKLDLGNKDGWNELHQKLGDIIGNHYMVNHDHIRPTRIVDLDRPEAVVKYFNLKPLTNTDYLVNERKISLETIHSPEFANKIFNKPFYDKKTETSGINTAFPVENEKGMLAIISRNTDWNMMAGAKDNGVWVSNIDLKKHQPKEMVIVESPIDALSYHQLHPPGHPLDRIYIATAGQPSSTQHLTIQGIINKTKPELLTLANDNEHSGIRFNIQMMSKLLMPNQPVTGISTTIASNKHTNTMIVEIDHRSAQSGGKSIEEIKDRLHQVLNRGMAEGAPKADIRVVTSRPDITQIEVDFPNQRHLLIRAESLTKEFRQTGEAIQIRRSIEKDFNQDLQLKTANLSQQAALKRQDVVNNSQVTASVPIRENSLKAPVNSKASVVNTGAMQAPTIASKKPAVKPDKSATGNTSTNEQPSKTTPKVRL